MIHLLAPSENYKAYCALFRKLKLLNYPLKTLVCDELESIMLAAKTVYPKVKIQLCTNHYKEGIRRRLRSRTNKEHEHFVKQIEHLFRKKSVFEYSKYARKLLSEHGDNLVYQSILRDMDRKHECLIRYLIDKNVPSTTNLVELFNSHLEARLRSMKGFNSFTSAEIWFNAYVVNRRLTPFKECSKKFSYLNGKVGLYFTAAEDAPEISLLKRVV